MRQELSAAKTPRLVEVKLASRFALHRTDNFDANRCLMLTMAFMAFGEPSLVTFSRAFRIVLFLSNIASKCCRKASRGVMRRASRLSQPISLPISSLTLCLAK
jgi:hypothetical protein